MVLYAGKFIYGAALELQSRVVLIPWVKKNSFMNCSKGRTYGSSYPVRYIPKKSSKTKELQSSSKLPPPPTPTPTPTPTKGSEDKEMCNVLDSNVLRAEFSNGGKSIRRSFVSNEKPQNKNKNQRPSDNLIFNDESEVEEKIDHKCGVEDYEFMEEPQEAVQELEMDQWKEAHKQLAFQAAKTKQDVEIMAVKLLATRAFAAVELKRKLLGKRCPHEIVDAVIMDFQSRGLINDCLYAETFSRSRWSSSSWGPRRIKQALFEKGVSAVDAEKAIKLVFEDDESGGDQEPRLGLSKLSMDHLFVQASKQWLRGQDVPSETRKSRIIRWLQYRGFNWGVINFVLKKLESEYPP